MADRLNPSEALPDEILAFVTEGVPLPDWLVGPLYTGNGSTAAQTELSNQLRGIDVDEPVDVEQRLDDFA